MSLELVATILGGLTIGSALMVVISKHPVRSVLFLVLTFFLISSNYILMNAQFLAIVNIIVYAGAIMVLFLFVLMLMNLNKESEQQKNKYLLWSSGIAGGMLMIVLIAALDTPDPAIITKPGTGEIGLIKNLGTKLFTDYVVPFEISSILFLSAM